MVRAFGMALLVAAMAAPAVGVELWVSTKGSDDWEGTKKRPFATLVRARDELRGMRDGGPAKAATVWVRGGPYYFEETLTLTAEDTGTAEAPITYRAWKKEEPILVGGAEVTGFDAHEGEIVKAGLKALGLEGLSLGELFYNGARQVLARYPNFDHDNPYAGGFLYAAGEKETADRDRLVAPPEGIREWADPSEGQVWVFPGTNYWNNIVRIASVDPETRVITLANEASYPINPGDRYFVRGFLEELDAPGEWYLDKETSTLYFWPPGELQGARVSVPRVGTIVHIAREEGQAEWPAYISLEGFTIEGCGGTAVDLGNARECAIVGCTIRNAGAGIGMSTCKNCLAYGNDIYQTGSSAITAYSGNRSPEEPDGNRIENNYIHHTGYFSKTSSAIAVTGVGNVVSHNLIHDTPRIAIFYGGNDHIIEYNHLRHMNLETQDSGATYCLGRDWTNRGHVMRYNYVHDTLGYGRHGGTEWHSPFYTFGIYLDDWSSGQHVYGNIVARSYLAGIDNHSGRDNVIENNIIHDCAREQFRYQEWPTSHTMLPDMLEQVLEWPHSDRYPGLARHKDHVADSTQSYNTFRRNILSYGRPGSTAYAVSGLDYETTEHDYNVIWRWSGEPDGTVEKMLEQGLDEHSVIADPKLRDPDNGDFTLAEDSPAFELGFEPIPFEEIGPYRDPRRASWPIVEAEGAREHPHKVARHVYEPPEFIAARFDGRIGIDGLLGKREWPAEPVVLEQEPNTSKGAKPVSRAWLTWDSEALYVGLVNEVKEGAEPTGGRQWGADDGAEVCLQAGDGTGPVFVLQGFPDGHFQSKTDAGATRGQARNAEEATEFEAKVGEGWWSGEWRVEWRGIGIEAKEGMKLRFNIGVRKAAGPSPWVALVGTGGPNFQVDRAGLVTLGE